MRFYDRSSIDNSVYEPKFEILSPLNQSIDSNVSRDKKLQSSLHNIESKEY